jgi:flagellar biosynthetic protein FliO
VNNQKKRVVVLCLLLVIGGGWVGLAGRYAGGRGSTDARAATSPASFLSDPNRVSPADISLGGTDLFLRMMLSVGLIAALGVAALYLSRKVLPKVVNAPGREIRVLETTYLGPRKALHLVEVAQQKLLLASTNDRITTLAHVGDTWLDIPRQDADDVVKV